jgi:transketolase
MSSPRSYEDVLEQLALQDENIIVMTAENRAPIRHLHERLGERFVDVGICEQTMVGAAAGLALRGRTPVVHALATFLTMRAFEFIRTDVGIGNLPVKLVGGVPGFLSEANGPTHQAVEDIALMRNIPHMMIFCPADETELTAGLPAFINNPSPGYLRYNALPAASGHKDSFAPGKAEILREGEDIAILTYGFLLREALKAADLLEAEGKTVSVLNMRTLQPVDERAILRAATECSLVVTLEDHFETGGLYTIVSEVLVKYKIAADVFPISLGMNWFRPALLTDVLDYEGFSGEKIANRILEYP